MQIGAVCLSCDKLCSTTIYLQQPRTKRMDMGNTCKGLDIPRNQFFDALSLGMAPETVRAQLSCLPLFPTTFSGNNTAWFPLEALENRVSWWASKDLVTTGRHGFIGRIWISSRTSSLPLPVLASEPLPKTITFPKSWKAKSSRSRCTWCWSAVWSCCLISFWCLSQLFDLLFCSKHQRPKSPSTCCHYGPCGFQHAVSVLDQPSGIHQLCW